MTVDLIDFYHPKRIHFEKIIFSSQMVRMVRVIIILYMLTGANNKDEIVYSKRNSKGSYDNFSVNRSVIMA